MHQVLPDVLVVVEIWVDRDVDGVAIHGKTHVFRNGGKRGFKRFGGGGYHFSLFRDRSMVGFGRRCRIPTHTIAVRTVFEFGSGGVLQLLQLLQVLRLGPQVLFAFAWGGLNGVVGGSRGPGFQCGGQQRCGV